MNGHGISTSVISRSRDQAVALVAAAVVVLGACAGGDDSGETTSSSTSTSTTTTEPLFTSEPPEVPIRIRGQAFSENETLAQAYGQYLNAKGYPVRILPAEGRRSEAITDLVEGEIDLIIDYLGGSQAAVAPGERLSSDPDETYEVIAEAYDELGATVLDYARADNDDAFVVRGDLAATTISDVRGLDLVFGAADECFDREQCYLGYTDPDVYDITFADEVVLDFGPPLGTALSDGLVDGVQWNSTAPQIRDQGFKVLEDDMKLHPAQNVVPILSDDMLGEFGEALSRDINSLSALITTEVLVQWNVDVDIFGETPATVALEWLAENRLLDGATATASNFVAGLQRDLQQLGYYTGPITGVYSLATEDAVLRFQIDNGLPPTGRLDEETAAAIQAALDTQESESVIEIQRILTDLGWYSGPIDGVYSAATAEAVRQFQAFLGVTPDGVVGPETVAAYEAQCANPANCRRPTDTTQPPATTPATTAVPTTAPPTSAAPTTPPPPETTAVPTTAVPTTAPPGGPTVRLLASALNTDETYDVESCTTDTNGDFVELVARMGSIELTLDDTTLERDEGGVVTDGAVTTVTLDADGALDAKGTVNLPGNPAWELTGTCANP